MKYPSHVRWIITLAAAAFIGVLVYSSIQQMRSRYEVCVAFKGATHCATASGSSYDQAVRSAMGIDCEMLANGRDENMACLASHPGSVQAMK